MDTIQKAIQTAIRYEEEAYKAYMKAYSMAKLQSTKVLFKRLAGEELKHKTLLKKMDLKQLDISKKQKGLVIAERLFLTPLSEYGSLQQVFKKAIGKEEKAYKRYINLSLLARNQKLKMLFRMIAKQEQNHRSLLKKEYALVLG